LSSSPEAGVSPASRTDKPRERALSILQGIERGGFVDPLLDAARRDFNGRDSAFILELVYGVLRNRSLLDWTLDRFSEKPIAKTDAWTRNILRIAAYQLIHLDRVPTSAAVNTATELAKVHGKKSGYVNGLLRTFERNKTTLSLPPTDNPLSRLSIVHSHPAWLVRRWLDRLGMQAVEEVLKNNNRHAPLMIRTNVLKGTRDDLLPLLEAQGASVRASLYSPAGIEVLSSSGIAVLPAYRDGWFMVQDEAAQLVGMMLSPQRGETILDACAAPGGKATHIAELMGDQGSVIALESDKKRIGKISENSSRLGIRIIRPVLGDAATYREGTYDRVLVDAPCSGLGVLRRHPDGRWTKTEESIRERAVLQIKIMKNCAKLLKPGGVLVYATCTTEPEENEAVVSAFISASGGEFRVDDPRPGLPATAAALVGPDGFFRTFPDAAAMDGFFGARIVKSK
jgi:16S rRNA (cytosine967-C5)-methyltransferase